MSEIHIANAMMGIESYSRYMSGALREGGGIGKKSRRS